METESPIILRAVRHLFRPVARILLRSGVNWKELAEVLKATYVEVASDDFGIRGRPTNISRVAILTGFTRREVRRLKDLLADEDPAVFRRMNYATRVLSGWYTDEDFTDGGKPRPLRVRGEKDTFEALCRRYSGDVPATTMLKELRHVGAVADEKDDRIRPMTRYYMPARTDAKQVIRSGSVLEDLGETVAHNLHRAEMEPSRFERRASNTSIPKTAIPAFRDFVEEEGQAFLERVDTWLTKQEQKDGNDCVRLGLGTYWIQTETQEETR